MPHALYHSVIPPLIHGLKNLSGILAKAQADADARKIAPDVFINARLAPDMFPLSRQLQIATDIVKACPSRLSGTDVPSYEDNETTFEELQARIAKTVAHLESFTPEQLDGAEGRDIRFQRRNGPDWEFKGADYVSRFVLPNFYFHVTTVYAILRHNGVPLGKADYLGL